MEGASELPTYWDGHDQYENRGHRLLCGIIGCWGRVADPGLDGRIGRGVQEMHHRGPDDSGLVSLDGERLVLGHSRLAILDLSKAGHQPMATSDGRFHLVYNGEIYNFRELRRWLEDRGVSFRSQTDTEVLLQLYALEGPRMVERLRGMFAFAVFDTRENRLFLARDRLGIKPLYLFRDPARSFWFASEVKALLEAGAFRPSIDPSGLVNLLAFGSTPAPGSIFAGVSKLEPGHTLTIESDGTETRKCYWDVFDGVNIEAVELGQRDSEERYLESLETHLTEAVNLRLVADVPVGTLLSGGVDSSLVTALAARTHQGIQTFSIGYRGYRQYDELSWAHRVAKHLGTEHADIWIDADDVTENLPSFIRAQEEPATDPQWLSVYFLSQLAEQHGVTVVLTGDGGDEVFAGYNKWQAYLRAYSRYWRPLIMTPAPARQLADALVGPLLGDVPRDMLARAAKGHEFFWSGTQFKDHQLQRLVRPEVLASVATTPGDRVSEYRDRIAERYRIELEGPRYLDWMTYVALKTSVAENFLTRLDKMGMAFSREGRVPLLDHEVIRLALSAPPSLRMKHGQGKYLLKRLLEQHLPTEIVYRPKMGFQSPIREWMEHGLESEVGAASEVFTELDDLIDPAEARRILSGTDQAGGWSTKRWLLVNLSLWCRSFLESARPPVKSELEEGPHSEQSPAV